MEQREYKRTHPWIAFSLDLTNASYRLWMLLGEAQSKCRHISGVPLRPGDAEKLHKLFLVRGARATTAIEGNTLTEDEVRRIVDDDLQLPPSRAYLKREVENIVSACNAIASGVSSPEQSGSDLTVEEILDYNSVVLENLPLKEDIVPGEIRTFPVVAGGYRGAPAQECRLLLEKLCIWLNDPDSFHLGERNKIAAGLLKAVIAHLYLVWIHPFGDGNGRVARLLEFRLLLEAGAPSPAAHLFSNHYNDTREEYYRHLELSWRKSDGVLSFLEYALEGFVDQLEDQIVQIRHSQIEGAWENYIHTQFADTAPEKRRKKMLLALSAEKGPVPKNRVLLLDTELASMYEGKTMKTVARDLSDLEKRGLIVEEKNLVRPAKERMLAFLPVLKPDMVPELLGLSEIARTS
ncbi:MAG: Fic family protein [Synergistota bacterium]|jgi:Fic family protein|nr:Fic family protein [Synergistota bacterium]